MKKTRSAREFGDFQTPLDLSRRICRLAARRQPAPASVVEPACGTGNFLVAVLETFRDASRIVALDINASHLEVARAAVCAFSNSREVQLRQADFFSIDWKPLLHSLPEPLLVVGNPPWVTNSQLSSLGSRNLPEKSNFQQRAGLDAMTGASNFDISEWLLIQLFEALDGRQATVAMLCKTAVARKVLLHAWRRALHVSGCCLYLIDAPKHFGAAVDACLLVSDFLAATREHQCAVYHDLDSVSPELTFGCRSGRLVASVAGHERLQHLEGPSPYRWRSGIKHDCRAVMELCQEGDGYRNAIGERVELEDDYLFPMLKSSELASGNRNLPRRFMLVTQRAIGEETAGIARRAPKTWAYLVRHAHLLDARRSSIYRNRPRFSVFGVGGYTFAPWKVAVSGLHKKLAFSALGPWRGKPVVLDDTSYFLACESEAQAQLVSDLLNSPLAREFYAAYIFWDSKRPLTAAVLGLLDLRSLARELGREAELSRLVGPRRADSHACGTEGPSGGPRTVADAADGARRTGPGGRGQPLLLMGRTGRRTGPATFLRAGRGQPLLLWRTGPATFVDRPAGRGQPPFSTERTD